MRAQTAKFSTVCIFKLLFKFEIANFSNLSHIFQLFHLTFQIFRTLRSSTLVGEECKQRPGVIEISYNSFWNKKCVTSKEKLFISRPFWETKATSGPNYKWEWRKAKLWWRSIWVAIAILSCKLEIRRLACPRGARIPWKWACRCPESSCPSPSLKSNKGGAYFRVNQFS